MCVEIVGAVEAITFQPFEERNVNFRRRRSVPFFFFQSSIVQYILSAPIRRTILPIVASLMSAFTISRNRMFPIMFRFLFLLRTNKNKKRLVTNVDPKSSHHSTFLTRSKRMTRRPRYAASAAGVRGSSSSSSSWTNVNELTMR